MYVFSQVIESTLTQDMSGYWNCYVELILTDVMSFYQLFNFEFEPTFAEIEDTARLWVFNMNRLEFPTDPGDGEGGQ